MSAYNRDLFNPPAPVALVSIQNPKTGETLNDVTMLNQMRLSLLGSDLTWTLM